MGLREPRGVGPPVPIERWSCGERPSQFVRPSSSLTPADSLTMAESEMSADQTELWQAYSAVLEQISATPYDRSLHERHVQLTSQLGLDAEASAARDLYADHFSIEPGEPCVKLVTAAVVSVSHRR